MLLIFIKGKMINRKIYRTIIFSLLVLFAFAFSACEEKKTEKRPNIVLIVADDMGYSDIGCYGGEISTPSIDKLAENGIRFNRFYNSTRCCPTRASLLTGMYSHKAGMGKMTLPPGREGEPGPYQGYLSRNAITIAEALKSSGYHSYSSGKWHVGEASENWPLERGFEHYFGLISGASSYFEIIKNQNRKRQMVLDNSPWEPPSEGFYMTNEITDYAIKWINEHNTKYDSPFFLYVAYTAPHWPLHALEEDIAKYENAYDIGWDSLRKARNNKQKVLGLINNQTHLPRRPENIPAWIDVVNKTEWSRRMEVYAAMVDRMDQGIGKIIQKLKDENQFENTIIIFISDNGASNENIEKRGLNNPEVPIGLKGSYTAYRAPWANVSNTPFRDYKKSVYEGGIASPFVAHWPVGIKSKGTIINQTSHVVDLLPTILDISKAKHPNSYNEFEIKPMDGVSLLPALIDGKSFKREPLFWEHLGNRAILEENWKLTAPSNAKWELYNLKTDVSEINNLAEVYSDTVKYLAKKYEDWARGVGVYEKK